SVIASANLPSNPSKSGSAIRIDRLRKAEDIREERARDVRVESRGVAVPMIGLQTRLVVVGPRRCSSTGGGRLGWRRQAQPKTGVSRRLEPDKSTQYQKLTQ